MGWAACAVRSLPGSLPIRIQFFSIPSRTTAPGRMPTREANAREPALAALKVANTRVLEAMRRIRTAWHGDTVVASLVDGDTISFATSAIPRDMIRDAHCPASPRHSWVSSRCRPVLTEADAEKIRCARQHPPRRRPHGRARCLGDRLRPTATSICSVPRFDLACSREDSSGRRQTRPGQGLQALVDFERAGVTTPPPPLNPVGAPLERTIHYAGSSNFFPDLSLAPESRKNRSRLSHPARQRASST